MNTGDEFRQDQQDELAKRIAYLINGYNLKTLSRTEHRELDDWVTTSLRNQQLFEELTDPANLKKWISVMEKLDPKEALDRIKSRIEFEPSRRSFQRWISWPYGAAAAVLAGVIFLGTFWFEKRTPAKPALIAEKHDLSPGGKHAILTLSDGTTILLDTLRSGALAISSGLKIIKDSANLNYVMDESGGKKKSEPFYNLLRTPAGGEFQLRLSDGTRVWLNASSSLKYPVQFTGSSRGVELSGEGYFEVVKDAEHPFIVRAGKNQIQVLGTRFNINAYLDSKESVVTLAEGSVKINGSVLLKAGEQAMIDSARQIRTGEADLETALAWKDGQFIFKMTPLDEVMKQTAHWYDARIVYQDNITEHFNGHIPRNVPVSRLLQLLEATGQVHFKIEDRTITVTK